MQALRAVVVAAYALFVTAGGPARADGDAANGKLQFDNHCATCHSAQAGENLVGPYLFGVVGRKAGTAAGYSYSASYVQAGTRGLSWSTTNLLTFLQNPSRFLQAFLGQKTVQNRMGVKFPDKQLRLDVIAYLSTLR
jgi:cytochrome c